MQVGQSVVCIDGDFPKPLLKYYQQVPEKDKTYTIRAVYVARGAMHTAPGKTDGELGLLLQELHNPPDPRHLGGSELGFNSNRFRPLETRDTEEWQDQTQGQGQEAELVYKTPQTAGQS